MGAKTSFLVKNQNVLLATGGFLLIGLIVVSLYYFKKSSNKNNFKNMMDAGGVEWSNVLTDASKPQSADLGVEMCQNPTSADMEEGYGRYGITAMVNSSIREMILLQKDIHDLENTNKQLRMDHHLQPMKVSVRLRQLLNVTPEFLPPVEQASN